MINAPNLGAFVLFLIKNAYQTSKESPWTFFREELTKVKYELIIVEK